MNNSPINLYDFTGCYEEPARQILVLPVNQQLRFLEPSTGHYRVFAHVVDNRFAAGSGFKNFASVEITATFQRDSVGTVTGVVWQQKGRQSMLARRISFTEREVTFYNGDVMLSGRLVTPLLRGPHPAIVMIHGSGPQARSELQPLVEYFASIGIAALAYDKRGVGRSSGQWQVATYRELADDALAGLRYLQSRPDINARQIGLWGISQGGWLGPLAASVCGDVAFIIVVSGPGVNPTEQETWRVEHMLRVDGFSQADIDAALTLTKQGLHLQQGGSDTDWDDFLSRLEPAKRKAWFAYSGLEAIQRKGATDPTVEPLEPFEILKCVSCPILAIFGELDPYLPVQESARIFEQALNEGANPDFAVKILPGGNHVMFAAVTGSPAEQASLPGFVPAYLRTMSDWLLKRVSVGSRFR
jgi:uncharacterized protein